MMNASEHIRVPRTVTNPAQYLIDHGYTEPQLAVAWRLRSTSSVQKIIAFRHVPKSATLELMGRTFGWSPGQVLDHWIEHVKAGAERE